ncbi:MAG: hypothetical protein NXI01_00410 [Gammaproteobacteria bacterium]|nr:hypothetical protein [Gammaproteobacteria bacterium]
MMNAVSTEVGYTINPLEDILKPRETLSPKDFYHAQQANPLQRTDYTAFVDAIGDGNCGPRAVIQSLLLRGMLHHQQQFVYDFLHGLCLRHQDNVAPYKDYQPYQAFPKDPRHPVGKGPVRLPLSQQKAASQEVLDFLDCYKEFSTTSKSLAHIRGYMPLYGKYRVRPEKDHIIYLLAAYLRFDIVAHIKQVINKGRPNEAGIAQTQFENLTAGLAVADENVLGDLATLEMNTDFQITGSYFAAHNIRIEVCGESGPNMVYPLSDNTEACHIKPQISIAIYRIPGGSHYATLINPKVDRLNPTHTPRLLPALMACPHFLFTCFNSMTVTQKFCLFLSICCISAGFAVGGIAAPIGVAVAAMTFFGSQLCCDHRDRINPGHSLLPNS